MYSSLFIDKKIETIYYGESILSSKISKYKLLAITICKIIHLEDIQTNTVGWFSECLIHYYRVTVWMVQPILKKVRCNILENIDTTKQLIICFFWTRKKLVISPKFTLEIQLEILLKK